MLTYSNWETAAVCFAESFESLSDGLQNALAEPGGVPRVHRTDALTAAVPIELNLPSYRAEQAKKSKKAKDNGEERSS